jgi:hypothetical protein
MTLRGFDTDLSGERVGSSCIVTLRRTKADRL